VGGIAIPDGSCPVNVDCGHPLHGLRRSAEDQSPGQVVLRSVTCQQHKVRVAIEAGMGKMLTRVDAMLHDAIAWIPLNG
jgi:hypothetical protein